MKQKSISTNFILNLLRIISATFVGIIMMPYVNRILGAESIGKIEYANIIVNYFVLFSVLGIPIYGIREIAKARNSIYERSKIVLELLSILFITTILSYIILFTFIFIFGFFVDIKDIIVLMSSMILLTNIGAEWYFQGMENQLYITIRYIIVRVVTLVLLFLFVKSPDNYLIYAAVLVLNFSGSNLFNLFYILKSIDIRLFKFNDLELKRHFRPICIVFFAAVSVNIYSMLDSFLIGYLVGEKYLGYYSVANKLIRYAITVITMIGAVVLPRLSFLWLNDKLQYYNLLRKTFTYIVLIAVPFVGYFIVFSKEIIYFMAGNDFLPSQITIIILSPLCLIVGIAYFLGYLMLYTQARARVYTNAVLFSALLSIGINFYMIKNWKQDGAAITQVIVEILAIIYMAIVLRKDLIKINILNFNILKIISITVMICIIFYFSNFDYTNGLLFFVLMSFFYFFLILMLLLVFRENSIIDGLRKINIKFIQKYI